MNMLNEVCFSCQQCRKEYKFKDSSSHIKQCNVPQLKCPLGCGYPEKFKGVERLSNHLATECTKVNLLCQVCKGEETLLTQSQHDCVVALLAKLELQEEKISKKDEEN